MGRRWRVFVEIVAVAGGWLAFGKDAMRERVVHTVAKKIGDFAAEERGLKDSVSRAEKATPPVAE